MIRPATDVFFVGDDDDCHAVGIQPLEDGHDFDPGASVEGAVELVRQNECGLVHQGAGDGDPRSSGELGGMMVHPVRETNLSQHLFGTGTASGFFMEP